MESKKKEEQRINAIYPIISFGKIYYYDDCDVLFQISYHGHYLIMDDNYLVRFDSDTCIYPDGTILNNY